MDFDKKYIQICIFLLKKILGTSFPNPPVVSLIVETNKDKSNSKIINFGFTCIGGRPHAEAEALKGVEFKSNFFYTLYSTLEPCSHQGREESCVSKIIKSKINKVVYSLKDPDRRVNGSGEKYLKSYGLQVSGGVMREETEKIYDGYILNRKFRRPKVTLKIACSLDSKIAIRRNEGGKITNDLVKKIVHIYRSEVDAILVGKNTVIVDDPKLDCRIKGLKNFSPIRVILSKKFNLNPNLNIFKNCSKIPTIIFTLKNEKNNILKFKKKHVKFFLLDKNNFNLTYILTELAKLGIQNLLVEGGGKIFTSFINEDVVDKIIIFRSDFFVGSEGVDLVNYMNKKKIRKFIIQQQDLLGNNTLEILKRS